MKLDNLCHSYLVLFALEMRTIIFEKVVSPKLFHREREKERERESTPLSLSFLLKTNISKHASLAKERVRVRGLIIAKIDT